MKKLEKLEKFLFENRKLFLGGIFALLFLTLTGDVFALQLTPPDNPFGSSGDQAIGGFGSNILTALNAAGFFGGAIAVFWAIFNIATGQPFMRQLLGAVGGMGGWVLLGAIAWQFGSNQAFQIPLVT